MVDWQEITELSLTEAACLIRGIDPSPLRAGARIGVVIPVSIEKRLERAVKARVLPAKKIVIRRMDAPNESILPSTVSNADLLEPRQTIVTVQDLIRYCEADRLPIPWPFQKALQKKVAGSYPDELCAAIEAYEAVSGNPNATKRQSPKAALRAWLNKNRPDLSTNARDRIATVANWQPSGGAPKTLE